MKIRGSVVLVTGANRGLGKALTRAVLAAGASKVYAAARDPRKVTDPGAIPISIDVSDPNAAARAAQSCRDVTLLINNAGVMRLSSFIKSPTLEAAREEMEVNYFGTLSMCRAFAPILEQNDGGAIVNILSLGSWFPFPLCGTQSASKAAELSLTDGIRIELRAQRTLVIAVYAGLMDTDMGAKGPSEIARSLPEDVARRVVEGIEARQEEVLADERSANFKLVLARSPEAIGAQMQRLWDAAHGPSASRHTVI